MAEMNQTVPQFQYPIFSGVISVGRWRREKCRPSSSRTPWDNYKSASFGWRWVIGKCFGSTS
jgi:hypothetical protein